MAIGRGSMTKELFGNRQKAKKPKKMAMGGMVTPTDMMNSRGREIAAQAQQGGMKLAMSAPSRIGPGGMGPRGMGGMPPRGMSPAKPAIGVAPSGGMAPMPPGGTGMMPKGPTPQNMKKGGSVRGCGCATRGKSGAKVY